VIPVAVPRRDVTIFTYVEGTIVGMNSSSSCPAFSLISKGDSSVIACLLSIARYQVANRTFVLHCHDLWQRVARHISQMSSGLILFLNLIRLSNFPE
jgi:hypothetical protein